MSRRLQALVTLLAIASTVQTVCQASPHGSTSSDPWQGNASSSPSLQSMPRSARIAIIGGGVSGVSAAETLVKHGFTNVVVFEAGSTIVPIQHAVRTAHAVYDMDLIYVPALSWTGSGLESRYEAVLREYQQELVPVTEFTSLSRENWDLPDATRNSDERWRVVDHNGTVVPQLREWLDLPLTPELGRRRLDEVQRFFHQFAPFFREHQYSGIQACLRHEIAWRNETFADWTQRHDFSVLHESAAHILGLYGNFPVGSSPACQVLMLLANKMPSILGPALVLASQQRDFELWQRESALGPLHDTMLLWFAQIAIDMPSFMRRFRHGYGAFFASVVLRNRIDYRTNSRVAQLEPFVDATSGRQRVRVHLTTPSASPSTAASPAISAGASSTASASASSELEFDAVLVTGRPDQVHHILPENHPMTPLYDVVKQHSQAVSQAHGVYGVAIVSFSVSPRAGFVAQPRFVLDHQKHNRAMYADRLSAVVNMMRVIKTTDEAILTVVFQTQREAVATTRERELLFQELALYGFRDLHVLKMVHYPNTPTRVPVSAVVDGWYERAEAAQGQQQLFFLGETFSGHGVPTVFMHTRDWCVRTFGLGRRGRAGATGGAGRAGRRRVGGGKTVAGRQASTGNGSGGIGSVEMHSSSGSASSGEGASAATMKTTAMTTHYLSGLAGDLEQEQEQDSDLDHGYGHIQAVDFDLDMDLDLDLDPSRSNR
ncbi:hypothetical protein PINS_up024003 [Pythium insidiosum]|nr:hypothetical protein PINS_up024003 [Pythium insidiosum]